MGIILKDRAELARMRSTGRIVAGVLDEVEARCQPGVTTAELEGVARRELERAGARSAFLGYRPGGAPPYPAVLCTSVNHVVVHGIPDPRERLREGDIVAIDFACHKDGYCADAARTVAVGVVSAAARDLIETTRLALARAIAECLPGRRLGDVGAAVQTLAEERGYGVVRDFVGHGIGREMHEAPSVPNFGRAGTGLRLRDGMALAIEPMLTAGGAGVEVLGDRWTVVTADGSLAAHFEHSIAITADGPTVLTA